MHFTHKAGFALALLTGTVLAAAPTAHAQTLTLGQTSPTLSGMATLTSAGTTVSGTYTYDDAGTGVSLANQNSYDEWDVYGSSTANISGGYITDLELFDTSTVNVTGGQFGGPPGGFLAADFSTLDLIGSGFTATYLAPSVGGSAFTVTGTLQDGTPLNVVYANLNGGILEFNGVPAVLNPVPEASSVVSLGLLLLLGLGGMAVSRKRKAGAAR